MFVCLCCCVVVADSDLNKARLARLGACESVVHRMQDVVYDDARASVEGSAPFIASSLWAVANMGHPSADNQARYGEAVRVCACV